MKLTDLQISEAKSKSQTIGQLYKIAKAELDKEIWKLTAEASKKFGNLLVDKLKSIKGMDQLTEPGRGSETGFVTTVGGKYHGEKFSAVMSKEGIALIITAGPGGSHADFLQHRNIKSLDDLEETLKGMYDAKVADNKAQDKTRKELFDE